MRSDHRPYSVKRLHRALERWYVDYFIRPQLEDLGDHPKVMQPWNLKIHGRRIRLGRCVHVITGADRQVRLTTWAHDHGEGAINIGDYCLICPGVRLDSACSITVGSNSMLAAGVYLTDADWHDIYDRSSIIGRHAAIVLEDNVWIGDSAIVCKGVTIGENSVIGAGSVVTRDIPANVIAAGNPAAVVRELDPERPLRKREDLLADPAALDARMDDVDRYLLGSNTWWGWLRATIRPGKDD